MLPYLQLSLTTFTSCTTHPGWNFALGDLFKPLRNFVFVYIQVPGRADDHLE